MVGTYVLPAEDLDSPGVAVCGVVPVAAACNGGTVARRISYRYYRGTASGAVYHIVYTLVPFREYPLLDFKTLSKPSIAEACETSEAPLSDQD